MYRFFINRPIVAMVIAILMVLVGLVSMSTLPIAQFPNVVPPEIRIQTTFVGADAETVQQSIATPIEEQMSGVDNMNYMYSINANNGVMRMVVNFDVKTDPNIDQMLAQLRENQAASQLPASVQNYGVTILKSPTTPMLLVAIFSPKGTYDATFLANYAYINLVDQITRVKGISNINVFGAGQYAMRFWVNPDQLAKLNITTSEVIAAVNAQNTVNPAGQIGGPPSLSSQEYTYTAIAQGRLITEKQFGDIIVRENSDGSVVRLKDVARVELGAQVYSIGGRLNGKPSAVMAIYQLPGSNAIDAANRVKALMENLKKSFPQDLDYAVSLDTTLAVSRGIAEILTTLWEALLLVTLVVYIFLQGWRASLIPLLAVPVSLIGTFILFPMFGFSINTLSLFGLVLAIGLVVDDAIVVVESVERHIDEGMSPKDAALKAMQEVSGPVVAIALILAAVFVPTVFIAGITGRLYQQFALTIAISVIFSAFNALTLSPALAALLLRKKKESHGPLARFFAWFNRGFAKVNEKYVLWSHSLIRHSGLSLLLLAIVAVVAFFIGQQLPSSFLPEEDQGYVFVNVQLPNAASLPRTDEYCKRVEAVLKKTPGVEYYTTVLGFSLLSQAQTTYNALFFVTLKPWNERKKASEQYAAIRAHINKELEGMPEAKAVSFPPPAIPGVGTAGGFTFILEDRVGKDPSFLSTNLTAFMEAAGKRKELASLSTTYLPQVPQIFVNVDRDKVLKQGLDLGEVYKTLQTFMGGYFVNYFNRFGRQWQVYVEADDKYRSSPDNIGLFYVRNRSGQSVPLSAVTKVEHRTGPEFVMHYNEYRSAQINGSAAAGYSSSDTTKALEEVFAKTMPNGMGFDYFGMSFQEQQAAKGVPRVAIFGLSLVFVFLILAALYESWSLPFSVLMSTPVAVLGAFLALFSRHFENNVYVQIGLIMLIGMSAKNAILIVEYAKTEVEKGQSLTEAALTAARIRLRPILMTSLAFVFGCVPLWFATGSGGISRETLGTVVIGGMLGSTLLGIFIIPVNFYVVEKLSIRHLKNPPKDRKDEKDQK
ncbi:MAG TPA: multidrug efflux RND transporter permease subunit [Candidatus Saccharimonadales bacterium]|nr:multidrug efflux RND transporter permease subunit [Candidatus Saccharimonadales bacterium]